MLTDPRTFLKLQDDIGVMLINRNFPNAFPQGLYVGAVAKNNIEMGSKLFGMVLRASCIPMKPPVWLLSRQHSAETSAVRLNGEAAEAVTAYCQTQHGQDLGNATHVLGVAAFSPI